MKLKIISGSATATTLKNFWEPSKRWKKVAMISSQPTALNSGKNRVENFMPAKRRIHSAPGGEQPRQKTWRTAQCGRNEKLLWIHNNPVQEILVKLDLK